MTGKWTILLVALVLAVVAAPVLATDYYVATDGDDDAGDGSQESPWATLQYAVENISAGDTILVEPGTYDGCRIEESGAEGSPKTLKAETSGTVLLNSLSAEARHSGVLEVEKYDFVVSYWVIEGFECDGVSGSYRPIDLRGTSHVTVTDCEAHDGVSTGIFAAFSDYVLIENCTSYSNGEHGIYVNNSADNGDVQGNTCYSNVSNGIHMNGDESLGGDGIMSNWEVDYNILYSNGSNGISCDGVTDSMFRNNLIYDTGSKGFTIYGIDGGCTSRDDLILNNTVVNPDGSYYCIFIHRNRRQNGDPEGMRIYNNILYHYSTATNRGSICMHTSGMDDFDSDYNAVMEYFGIDDNKSQDDFSEWQSRGYDTNSIQETDAQLFDDAGNDDYHLNDNSDAVDGGTTLGDVDDDLEGTSRPQGNAYDMGCYED